jgi:hypothetical protein
MKVFSKFFLILSFLIFQNDIVIAQTGSQQALSQRRTVHSDVIVHVVDQAINTLDKVKDYYTVQVPLDHKYGQIWDLVTSKSRGIDNLTPTQLVVKEVWGSYYEHYSPVVEHQIFDPENSYNSEQAIAVLKQQFILGNNNFNSIVYEELYFDQKIIATEDENKSFKAVYRFRKDGNLAVRFLYKEGDGEWEEDAFYLYKNSNVKYDEDEETMHRIEGAEVEGNNGNVRNLARVFFAIAPTIPKYDKLRKRKRRAEVQDNSDNLPPYDPNY